jgi:hypothetical protein
MQKLASIVTVLAVTAAVMPGAASAKPVTRHHNPIAHIAVAKTHGKTAHKRTGPR